MHEKTSEPGIYRVGKNRYRIQLMVGGVRGSDTIDGTMADAKSAKTALAESLGKKAERKGNPSLNELWPAFVRNCKDVKGLKPQTMKGYADVWKNHVSEVFGDLQVADMKVSDVAPFLQTKTRSVATHCKALLSAMFTYAEECGYIDDSIMRHRYTLPKSSSKKKNPNTYDWQTIEDIGKEIEGEIFEPAYILMAAAGLRREEACAVQPRDIEESRGWAVVHVKRTSQVINKKIVIDEPKTEQSERTAVVFGDKFGKRLIELRNDALSEGKTWMMQDENGLISPDRIAKAWERWFKCRPYVYIPLSNLRASFSTAMTSMGYDAAMISKITGHAKIDVQYTNYLRPTTDDFISHFEKEFPTISHDS